ncbi:hypothetical protein Ab1vBOLIVR4_gp21c [Agrobacterium phage OLIVR4]|nr:hypothetical protein Ab1vBOLIVR4_gp21c [Agrobacterium phage OLIVR4]
MDDMDFRAFENVAAALERIYKRGYKDEEGQYLTNDRDFHRVSEFVNTKKAAVKIATSKTYGTFS